MIERRGFACGAGARSADRTARMSGVGCAAGVNGIRSASGVIG
jgi:hypothetical protein